MGTKDPNSTAPLPAPEKIATADTTGKIHTVSVTIPNSPHTIADTESLLRNNSPTGIIISKGNGDSVVTGLLGTGEFGATVNSRGTPGPSMRYENCKLENWVSINVKEDIVKKTLTVHNPNADTETIKVTYATDSLNPNPQTQTITLRGASAKAEISCGDKFSITKATDSVGDVEISSIGGTDAVLSIALANGSGVNIAQGSNRDTLIAPSGAGASVTAKSGPTTKAIAGVVKRHNMTKPVVTKELVPPNVRVKDASGKTTVAFTALDRTAKWGNIVVDGTSFTGSDNVDSQTNILYLTHGSNSEYTTRSGMVCSKPLVAGQRNVHHLLFSPTSGTEVCGGQRTISGSQLDIYEPEALPAVSQYDVSFVYESADPIWNTTTTVNPPAGCTADKTSDSVQLSTTGVLETKSVVFTVTCFATSANLLSPLIKTAKAQTFGQFVKELVGKEFGVSHKGQFVDQSGQKPPKPFNLGSTIRLLKAAEPAHNRGNPQASNVLQQGSSLWSLVRRYLGNALSVDLVKQAVKKVAEYNGIKIPEWGLTSGDKDARKLWEGSVIDLSPLKEYLDR